MKNGQKIIPYLWFDKEAKEASEFYVSLFPGSQIISQTLLKDTPSGDCDFITFELSGYTLMAISAGPYFKLNPSISFMVNFDPSRNERAREHLDILWEKLSLEGEVLMPLGQYPFSEHYGWIQDKYGLSWQLILTNPYGEERPFIIPSLLFVGDVCGKAEEAINHYCAVFPHSRKGINARYPGGMAPEKKGDLMFGDFKLEDGWFAAVDSAREHKFSFNEAVSLLITCETQEEIDYYWGKLSAVPEAEQCGWLKDRYGVSWQVWPLLLGELMEKADREQMDRLTRAFLTMKKFDIAQLKEASGLE